jgi:hypothetical protein
LGRSIGVTLLGAVAIGIGTVALGVFAVLVGIGLMGIAGGAFTTSRSAGGAASSGGVAMLGISLIGLIGALIVAALGVGLLQRRAWAWIAAVVTIGAVVLVDAVTIVAQAIRPEPNAGLVFWGAIILVISGGVLAYLVSPPVRDEFGVMVSAFPARRRLQTT